MTGEGVARGYLNKPEITERSFVQILDATGKLVRGYRSGDLGRYNPDGTLDFHGRKDDQVKINGLRIEPGEIKNILQSHPEIAGAEVVVVENEGRKRLQSFVVRRPGMNVDERTLRKFLGEKIPGNWLPSSIRIIPSLPLTPNGKVDRRALIESLPSRAGALESGDEEEPQDSLERAIWNIWREILPGTSVNRHDRFAELGGDSLSALHMMARVEKMLGAAPSACVRCWRAARLSTWPMPHDKMAASPPPPLMICTQAGQAKPPLLFHARRLRFRRPLLPKNGPQDWR